jgi:membrane-associated phospholipid phosphatase
METKFAKAISIIFHPLLLPTYAMLILINIKTHHMLVLPQNFRYMTVLFVFLTSFVMPTLIFLILLKLKKIKSLEMPTSGERTLPLFIVALFFYATYYLLKQGPHFALFNIFMLGATLLVIISMLINYFSKISIHMVAAGGLFGTFAGFSILFNHDLTFLLYLIVLVAGLVGYARLELKAHTPRQVYAGFLLGTVFMLSLFLVI